MKTRTIRASLQRGFSLLEVVAASVILATAVAGAGSFQSAMLQKTTRNNDKTFASEKALQMYDEMRSFVQSNQESFITSLDNFSDGNGYDWMLTTSSGSMDDPADPLSGNERMEGNWRFIRQIQVDPVLNDDYARQVRVKVWRADPNDNTKPSGQPLAAISGILKTNVDQYPPTQVYDVFMFTAENAPAWWVDIAALRPTFERLLDDLEFRNPGLRYRRHYVSRLGFGRDPFYLPYMNSAANANAQDIPWTYFYPGKISRTNPGLPIQESYVEDYMHGRRRNDSASQFTHAERALNGSNATYRPYAMADQFNHVKRYPENAAMLRRLRYFDPETEVDLVTYLEEMNSNPDTYRNSLIINLHGELVPFPAIRNYSDAAKSPDRPELQNLRVVTHPERIRYDNSATDLNLRVHAYQKVPYGEERLEGDSLNASTENNANNAANQAFMLDPKNTVDAISLFIPTDGRGRHPVSPDSDGFLDHPTANPTVEQALANIAPQKIVGNHRRPYALKNYIGRSSNQSHVPQGLNLATELNLARQDQYARQYYRQTTNTDVIGKPHTIELSKNPRLPSAINYVRGGIQNTVNLNGILNGSVTSLVFNRNDFTAYLRTAANNDLQFTLNELIDQVVILDPDVKDPNNSDDTTNTIHEGLKLELRVMDFDFSGNTVILNFYSDSRTQALWQQQVASYSPGVRLPYARNNSSVPAATVTEQLAEVVNLTPAAGGNTHVLTGNTLNIGTRVVMKRDFEVTVNPQVFGKTVPGIHIHLFDTPTRHMQKEGNDVFPIWNANANGEYRGQYSGLFHNRGNDNTNAHQNGDTRRLNREEYVPAPVNNMNTNAINDDFDYNLTLTDGGSGAGNAVAKNTARWVVNVNLDGLNAETGSAFANEMTTVETRIATLDDARRNSTDEAAKLSWVLEQGESEDGDIYKPNSTSTSNENRTQVRNSIYNVSRTFFWTGSPATDYDDALENARVPYVERRQYLGDPRYFPYADLKAVHTYNRHFYKDTSNQRGFAGLTEGGMGGYNGYDRHTGPSWGGNNVAADMNWYFQLYTNGIMRSNSIYNSVTGYSNYYYAIGGEMGSDGNSANFDMRRQPWSENSEGSSNASNTDESWGNEIIGSLRIPMSTDNTTSGNSDNKWYANPFSGELFPDEDYAFWRTNGNLPNRSYNASAHNFAGLGLVAETSNVGSGGTNHRFYRANYTENPINLSDRELRLQGTGSGSFMNGNNNPTGSNINKAFNHISAGTWGNLTSGSGDAGRRLADAFNLALPSRSESDRPFVLSSDNASGGYTSAEMKSLRNRLSFINSVTGATSGSPADNNTFYRHESAGDRTASAVVQLSRDGDPSLRGFVLMNGFARSQVGGDQTIARLSQAGSMQAYMDAGDTSVPGDAEGRTVQIPRVEITAPKSSIITSNSATVKFDVSWLRWDGEKYSPAYPEDWYDVTPLVFNAKYFDAKQVNPQTGQPGVWVYVNSTEKANEYMTSGDLSYYNSNRELLPGSSPESMSSGTIEKSFSWDVSGLEDGNYKLRVECYRDEFERTGYTYHDVYITIKR